MPRACVPALVLLLASACTFQQEEAPDAALRRGCQYLWSQQGQDGGWHSRTYGLLKSGQSLTGCVLKALVAWLRTQQFTEEHGWQRGDAAYGAWGMGGEPRIAPNAGHVDLSMTRHALQALAAAGVPASDPAFARARVFVERCQNADGGF